MILKNSNIICAATLLAASALSPALAVAATPGQELPKGSNLYTLFEDVPFYDGYNSRVADADLFEEDGILRHTNYLYATRLDTNKLLALGDDLKLEVLVGALCDNYDRMGRVLLAFPEAGSESYDPETTTRLEIARFITPFMNKNKQPDTAPYVYDVADLRQVLSDAALLDGKDVWLETEIFGMPYSANKQIAGCAGRSDVFSATVTFGASDRSFEWPAESVATVVPITLSRSEIHGNVNLNNYNTAATDTIGTTTRTYTFDVPADLDDAIIYFINSNHGADEDGEEYNRREHLIYVDGEITLVYTPGGESCEPYRYLNTQGNGIYDLVGPETAEEREEWDAWWAEWNNWCPGSAIPIRRIALGAVKAGSHSMMIRVPDAVFNLADGDFRPSAFLLGVTGGKVADPSEVEAIPDASDALTIVAHGDILEFHGEEAVKEARIYAYDGTLLEGRYNPGATLDAAFLPAGQYIVTAITTSGKSAFLKYIRR